MTSVATWIQHVIVLQSIGFANLTKDLRTEFFRYLTKSNIGGSDLGCGKVYLKYDGKRMRWANIWKIIRGKTNA